MPSHRFATIGFIGAGNMARALARGIAVHNPELRILASDPSPQAVADFRDQVPGAEFVDDNASLVAESDITVLAVKPQQLDKVFPPGPPPDRTLLVSVLAGVKIDRLETATGQSRVIRVMPNTPCLIGQGAIGYCVNRRVTEVEEQFVVELLESTGIVRRVDEPLIDVVTAVSGSGPAYLFYMIEAMIEAGAAMGLSVDVARDLAIQTVIGAGEMARTTGQSPAALRTAVTSPGGTTAAALAVFQQADFTGLVKKAMSAAAQRAAELSNG